MAHKAAFDPVSAAQDLAPMIAERAPEIEAARRLPADIAASLAGAGLFRMVIPRAYGGHECAPDAVWRAIETVATADASAAWCLMIGASNAVTAAYLPERFAREIFADPEVITGGVFAPMGKAEIDGDDFIVSGRWPWGSGSANCAWLMGGCVVYENGAPRLDGAGAPMVRQVFFPRAEVQLDDTWHVTGLRGTGSGDLVLERVRAPRARSVSLTQERPQSDGALYAFPVFGLLAMGIAAVASGNARSAIADLVSLAGVKRPQASSRSLAQRGAAQEGVARAEALLRSGRAFMREAIAEAWEQAQGGAALSLEHRMNLRLAATHLTRAGAEVCRMMYDLAGGTAVFNASPLQRRFRDAHVATQHIMCAPPTYELCGRVLLGLETDVSFL